MIETKLIVGIWSLVDYLKNTRNNIGFVIADKFTLDFNPSYIEDIHSIFSKIEINNTTVYEIIYQCDVNQSGIADK